MTLPNFIIIGAGRSGTTSLYEYLAQHPEIAMSSIKETRYFAWLAEQHRSDGVDRTALYEYYPVRTLQAYEAQFAHAVEQQAIGEASPRYLFVPGVPEAIAERLGPIKLVAILRDPVRRAWAQYMARHRIGWEQRSFAKLVADEIEAIDKPVMATERAVVRQGLYYAHLSRFLSVFSKEQLLVLFHDDLVADTPATVRRLLRFLEVDDRVELDLSKRFNPTGMPRNRLVETLMSNRLSRAVERALPRTALANVHRMTKPLRAKNTARPIMPADVEQRLRLFYRSDTEALQDLLGHNLRHWDSGLDRAA